MKFSLITLTTTLKCKYSSKIFDFNLFWIYYKGIEQKCSIPKRISRSILMIGTSIFFIASPFSRMTDVIFIAYMENVQLTISELITIG